MSDRRKYLTPPSSRGRNHLWRGEGTKTLCSRTEGRHANYKRAETPRADARMCLQCERIAERQAEDRP